MFGSAHDEKVLAKRVSRDRECKARILQAEFDVTVAAEDCRSPLAVAVQLKPDIILLPIYVPLLNGVEAARRLARHRCRSQGDFCDHARGRYLHRQGLSRGGLQLWF